MTVDTERLRQLALSATPGPWEWTDDGELWDVADTSNIVRQYADREFIAAANPSTVLALLDRIEALGGLLREATGTLGESAGADSHADFISQCRAALAK